MSNRKKQWTRPQLIVLARGTAQENVLTACKTQNPAVNLLGPQDDVSQDQCASGSVTNCSNCKPRAFDAT